MDCEMMDCEMMRYYSTRKPFIPEVGKLYENAAGGVYYCLKVSNSGTVIMRNTVSGWTAETVGVGIYEDGKIDWDYSLHGHFSDRGELWLTIF